MKREKNQFLYGGYTTRATWRKKMIAWWTLILFMTQPILVSAEVIADPNGGQHKPTVDSAANGIPIVQITTPSAAGVSRNFYQTFNVDSQGLILNNAGNLVQTQLAGYITGNPFLANGSARIILNEVTSSNPTYLRGYTEIAGQKGELVIANPNGITGNGFGFINTSRATLTTGAPVFGGSGSLDAFRVTGGTIAINGTGLDASTTDRVDLLSRVVQVNASIWAKELNVVTGTNKIDASTLNTENITGDNSHPQIALDVSALGGMYANKIKLIGTETGVGVNSQGIISAGSGNLILTQAGKVILGGTTSASGNIQLDTTDAVSQTGVTYAQGDTTVNAASLTNSGVLAAGQNTSATAQTITSTGTIGAGILGDGTLSNGGNLTLTAGGTLLATGKNLAGANLDISGQVVNVQGALTFAGGQGTLTAGNINNTGGSIQGNGSLTLTALQIDNTQGLISSGQTLTLQDANLAHKNLFITNRGGTLLAGQQLNVDSAGLSGDGKVLSQGNMSVKLTQDYTHTGELQANGNATLETTGIITNQSTLLAGNNITITASNMDNTGSGEVSAQNTTLTTAGILTNRGLIDGGTTLVQAGTLTNLGTGRIYGDHLAIQSNTLNNDTENGVAAVMAARGRLDIGAQIINNREHALLFSAGDMAIGGSLDVSKQATGQGAALNNSSATIQALGNLSLASQQINNTNAHFSTYVQTTNIQPIIEYQGSGSATRYTAGTPGVYIFNDESDHLRTPEGDFESWTAYNYTQTTTETKVQSSDPAKILSGGGMQITGDTLTNDKSHIIAGGTLSGNVGTLNNIQTPGERTITDNGTVTSYWRHHREGSDSTGSSTADYNPAATIQTIFLNPTVYQQNTAPVGTGTPLNSITQVAALTGTTVVRSGSVNTNVPNNSLFSVTPNSNAHYLVETDPRFADYRQWISSDYMLQALALDPSMTQKRLGDGFYEQQLIREQVTQLTGRRFLDGYASDETQYMALMNNATTFAQKYQLRVGIALTADQMAQLTSDMVWLVEKDVHLPNGQITRALVPQLYVHGLQNGDLSASGALMAGSNVQLALSKDLINSGTIAGRNVVALTAENIQNLGGRITGNDVGLQTRTDLDNVGGRIEGTNSLVAIAGRDLNLVSTTRTQTNKQGSQTNIDSVAGLYVTGDQGSLLASAGRDINLTAAQISNSGQGGDTALTANNNLNLGTVTESTSHHIVWDKNNHRSDSSRSDVGTTIQTQGDIHLQAGNDLNAKAASVSSSQGALVVTAGQDVNLMAGETNQSVDESHQHKEHSLLSSKTITTRDTLDATTVQGTTLSGDTTTVLAGRDLTIQGSNVVATNALSLAAQGNISITATQETSQEEHLRKEETSGIFSSGGFGFTAGSKSEKTTNTDTAVTAMGSTIGSIDGSISITAGNKVNSAGTTFVAGQDLTITGKDVTIENTINTVDSQSKYEFKQSGVTVSVGNAAITAATNAAADIKRSGQVEDSRLKALYDYKAAKEIKDLGKALNTKVSQAVSLSISMGSSQTTSEETTHTETVNTSNINAGGNVNITATDGDVTLKGTNINATDITLDAAKNITIEGAENKQQTDSKSSSSSWSAGGTFGTGYFANASKGSSKENENSATNTASIINASGTLKLKSGEDTNIIGSQVKGDKVVAKIGGNLNVISKQDTDNYTANNESSSFGASTGQVDGKSLPPGTGPINKVATGGVTGSYSAGKTDSNYASVTEQAGIFAGKGGFDITVGKNTDLKGAVIASTATTDKNTLSTGSLTYSDIQNNANYSASSTAMGYSWSAPIGKDANGKDIQNPNNGFSSTPGMPASGDASSTTKSAISPGIITITGKQTQDLSQLSRDTGNSLNTLGKIFDKKTVAEQQELATLFDQEASKAIGDLAESMRSKATTDAEKAKWTEGGEYKVLLHAVVGGITSDLAGTGFTSGAVGAGVTQAVQKELANITDPGLRLIASSLIGATAAKIVGGNAQAGASAAFTGTKYNDYLHKPTTEGSIIHTKDGWFQIIGGIDTPINEPNAGTYFWDQDDKQNYGTMGTDYIKGDGITKRDQSIGDEDNYIDKFNNQVRKNTQQTVTTISNITTVIVKQFTPTETNNTGNNVEKATTPEQIDNPITKSLNSFQEIGSDFNNGLKARADTALNSPYDFANYVTIGLVDGVTLGAKNRADTMLDSKYNFANWASVGAVDMVNGAINPTDPLSKEHWLNSFGTATIIAGGIKPKLSTSIDVATTTETVTTNTETQVMNTSWKFDQQLFADGSGSTVQKVEYGDQYTKVDGRKALKPNIEYSTVEGYKFDTDDNGRIKSVEANLDQGSADRNQYAQRIAGGDDRLSTDDGGHLIASIFKGSGELDNLVPMDSTLNRSEYKILENTWKNALQEGKEVSVKINPLYEDNSVRPSEFKVDYTIDGKKYSRRLTN